MKVIGEAIAKVINNLNDKSVIKKVKKDILELCKDFPLYPDFDVWDASTVNLEFACGAFWTISSTCMSHTWGQSSLRVLAHYFIVSIHGADPCRAGKVATG